MTVAIESSTGCAFKPSSIGGFLIVLASTVTSVMAYTVLAESIRIRWVVGTYQHYGPEHAPTLAVLIAFPLILAGISIGFVWLKRYLNRTGKFDEHHELHLIYEFTALSVLIMVFSVQIGLIAANIYL